MLANSFTVQRLVFKPKFPVGPFAAPSYAGRRSVSIVYCPMTFFSDPVLSSYRIVNKVTNNFLFLDGGSIYKSAVIENDTNFISFSPGNLTMKPSTESTLVSLRLSAVLNNI
jgi:hypothetical protein